MKHPATIVGAAVLICTLIAGCGAPMLHPVAIATSAVRDPGLVGEWASEGETSTRAVIRPPEDGDNYRVSLTVEHKGEHQTALSIDLTLTDIGSSRYADLFLAAKERDQLVGRYGFLVVPVHQTMKIARSGDELRIWSFNGAWLDQAASESRFSHDTVTVGGGRMTIVTAPTESLRTLIIRHGDDPGTFGAPMVFHRVVTVRGSQ